MSRLTPDSLVRSGHSPSLDRDALRTGVVHLGAGAFFRAHTAVYTEDAMLATGDTSWGISAVTGRSARVWEQMAPQDGLFTVTERGPGSGASRVVSAVTETLAGPRAPLAVVERVAAPGTRVVTLTVTEKGYRADPLTGRLDVRDPAVRADLEGAPPLTAVGRIARGLQLRMLRDAGPVSVVSCDNLSGNGDRLGSLVADFADALPGAEGERLRAWTAESVSFPDTMVDRMVPATTAEDLDLVEGALGLRDEAAVIAEPFRQWVVEDRFAAARPPWERAGALLTGDVRPWEEAKLRVLNAGHSLLAYLGLALGHRTIAACAADPVAAEAAHRLVHEEALPSLRLPDGLDGPAYAESVLARFANPALGHTTAKVAADGSQKIGPRLLPTVRAVLDRGGEPRWSALAVAAWMHHVAAAGPRVEDPLAATLAGLLPDRRRAADVVPRLMEAGIFPGELVADGLFTGLVAHWYGVIDSADTLALGKEIAL
ncbi:mannitol dehydrogenase family protein [Nocardiopsis sp. NPDC006198]|uniref:mannitol dehydrogenase family protein n=1 Tax=Nocardiopsis sp. NPDC006198 TaxID=3154472 RepID=UPI0033A1F7D8